MGAHCPSPVQRYQIALHGYHQVGMSSINSVAPSRPTVMMTSPRVLLRKPASQYLK